MQIYAINQTSGLKMKTEKILDMIHESDVQQYQDLGFLLDTVGLDVVKQLLLNAQGFSLHIPQLKNITPLVHRYVMKLYHEGRSLNQIANEVELSRVHVRRIIKRHTH